MADKPSKGLAGIIAVSTALSDGDGRRGRPPHVMEQHADNRLIRPDSEYVGERGLTWTPLDRR